MEIVIPHDAVLFNDIHCCNSGHIAGIMSYASMIADACLQASAETLPVSKQKRNPWVYTWVD